MSKAALYARYSSDKQRETSIVDQLRGARARAAREGWDLVAEHKDEEISGSVPLAMRPGGKALLADALAHRWDILILEGLDRLSREVGEQESIVKRLEHRNIRIIGISDGYDTAAKGRKVMRIARGLVNELYLDDLAEKTHRGLSGQFDRGFSAGGRTYGYRSIEDGRGRRLMINDDEAAIVREVFTRFVEGASVTRIVHDLNTRGVPSSRGGTWAVSAIHGSAGRGLGMLCNELYRGHVIWNRRQWLKDPDTGKRRYVVRPESEWLRRKDETLVIIDAALWSAAQARIRKVRPTISKGRPARTLFGGLLRCPTCSGPIIAVNSTRYGCNTHKDRGPSVCPNDATISRALVDRRLLTEVREQFLEPGAMAEMQATVREFLTAMQREAAGGLDAAKRRLKEVEATITRLVDAVAQIGLQGALGERLQAAEEERKTLLATLATASTPPAPEMVADILARYTRMLMSLEEVLKSSDLNRTRELLAEMLGPVILRRDADGVAWAQIEKPVERLITQAVNGSLNVVAGAGFEPTTFGL